MNSQETHTALQFLNDSWAHKPLADGTAKIWGLELRKHPAAQVMGALTQLARTSKWRPSLAEILELVEPPDPGPDISAAFADVLHRSKFRVLGRKGEMLAPEIAETVRRLGGWVAVGQWSDSELHWRRKDFERVAAEVRASVDSGALALPPPAGPRALPTGREMRAKWAREQKAKARGEFGGDGARDLVGGALERLKVASSNLGPFNSSNEDSP